LLRLLRERQVDLALLVLPVVAKDLEVVPVLREELVVVSAPGHPLTRARSLTAKQIARVPLILYEPGSNTRALLDRFFLEAGAPVEVAMETENVEIIKAMVAAGLGVTLVPYAAVARDIRARRFAFARVHGRALQRETGWVFRRGDEPPRAVREMLRVFDALRGELRVAPPGRSSRRASGTGPVP
jgi:DNA-binding transcriptional LysR family regulator